MAKGKVYSFEEVKKHGDRDDCWLVIDGKVYDVTPFMEEHPGGDEVLLACIGKDATADFEDIGHSSEAKEMMPQYCIGEVDAATIPARIYHSPGERSAKKATATATAGAWATLLQLAAPVLLLALAFALQSYNKAKAQ